MDVKKMGEAHKALGKCLGRSCDHGDLSKCVDTITDSYKTIGDELKGETEKSVSKVFDGSERTNPSVVHKALESLGSVDPIEID